MLRQKRFCHTTKYSISQSGYEVMNKVRKTERYVSTNVDTFQNIIVNLLFYLPSRTIIECIRMKRFCRKKKDVFKGTTKFNNRDMTLNLPTRTLTVSQ